MSVTTSLLDFELSGAGQVPRIKTLNKMIFHHNEFLKYVPEHFRAYTPFYQVVVDLIWGYLVDERMKTFLKFQSSVSPMSFVAGGYRDFLFDLSCWWWTEKNTPMTKTANFRL